MAKSTVKMDSGDLEKLKKQILKYGDETNIDLFLQSCAKELAARLLRKLFKTTLPGQYPPGTGKVGGTLRRGWLGDQKSVTAAVNNLKVKKQGHDYVIEIINPVDYASYVEYGHRTRGHKSWVEGKFYMTISEKQIQNIAPAVIEKKLKKYLGECFK